MAAPLLEEIRKRQDVQKALRDLRTVLDTQRIEVIEILCSDPSPPETFKPAPETCAEYRPQT